MVFDIDNKLRNLLNFNKSSSPQPSKSENKRKRKSENCFAELCRFPNTSLFSVPEMNHRFVKNTVYADVEFSDDDDLVDPKPSGSIKKAVAATLSYISKNFRSKKELKFQDTMTSSTSSSKHIDNPSMLALLPANNMNPTYVYSQPGGNQKLDHRASNSSCSSSEVPTFTTFPILHDLEYLPNTVRPSRRSVVGETEKNEHFQKYVSLWKQAKTNRTERGAAAAKYELSNQPQVERTTLMPTSISSDRSSKDLPFSPFKPRCLQFTTNLDIDESADTRSPNAISPETTKNKLLLPANQGNVLEFIHSDEETHILRSHVDLEVGRESPRKTGLKFFDPVNNLRERFNTSTEYKDNWHENFAPKSSLCRNNVLWEDHKTDAIDKQLINQRHDPEVEIQDGLRNIQIVEHKPVLIDDCKKNTTKAEFIEFSKEHRDRINAAILGAPDQILTSKFNLNITRRDLRTLCGSNWLNDQIINFYMNLLIDRSEQKNSKSNGLPSVYAMNTFFFPVLLQAGYGGVRRWTRKVDIFTKDIIPIPLHLNDIHWSMAIIHLKNRTIKLYNSMGSPSPKILKVLEQYLKDESIDKRKKAFDTSQFTIESVPDVPQQTNGSDCGVFSCMFAEYVTRDKKIDFSQANMKYFREKMILEIVEGKLWQ
uniref:Ubiquitin-like protease family profile domain-containing protein n=1 Tax=Glossina pallidipes TaxID=7398 RepID=A0A1A9ZJL6_GLOPL